MAKYIDLHCHPFREYFANPQDVLNIAYEQGVGTIFLVGTNLQNSQEALTLARQNDFTHAIIGIHPSEATDVKQVDALAALINSEVVGIGEIGLDYHYPDGPDATCQQAVFAAQVELARRHGLPVVVHSRDADEDTYQFIKTYKQRHPEQDFILHSYSAGPEYVPKYLALGVYFSFSGVITFKNAPRVRAACALVPLERLFCETDVPYLAPVPHRGQTNLPQYIIYTTDFVAALKGVSSATLRTHIARNVQRVFKRLEGGGRQ